MALTNSARSKLFKLVQQSKKLLYKEIEDQLQLHYGIFPEEGKVVLVEELTTSDSDLIYTAKLLRDRLTYLVAYLAQPSDMVRDSIEQLIREQAFSILNRMAALRMAEERGIIRETVGKFYNSEGFQVYDSITGQGVTTSVYGRYKWYIHSIFDELALDLPSIFDRFSPYALIFPSEKSLKSLLEIINNDEVSIHREEGSQPLNLWRQDETIGWIYQYYNSKDEIKAMRDASDAPRNSRELAVRNQFFTPRYVVQFLTDNSLGRIWYEMTRGKTDLISVCHYLIRRPKEVFLDKGQTRHENTDESTDYIEHRPLKDPREILVLDPACGSMHFGLYSFDLMEVIYKEAWDNYPALLTDLRLSMTRQQFLHQVPELVIRHNIHGVDIDPRALQIAALSLWLRAQKSFERQGMPTIDRPSITRSNLVLAEAMPGSVALLTELVKPLDKPMRVLMLAIWEKMHLAGETGLLLRIENEIDETIKEIAKDLSNETKRTQLEIGSTETESLAAEKSAVYATKKYRDEFLTNAESEVLNLLRQLAEAATNGDAYQKLLFADDTARGFAFIEVCKKRYDVVVMNPPFGSASISTESYLQSNYEVWGRNILAAFFERMLELVNNEGLVGSIFDRTVAIKSSYEHFRVKCFCGHMTTMADTGWNVLDANVETTTTVLSKNVIAKIGVFVNLQEQTDKDEILLESVSKVKLGSSSSLLFYKNSLLFLQLPNKIIGYYLDNSILNLFRDFKSLEKNEYYAMFGSSIPPQQYLRLFFELNHKQLECLEKKYVPYYLGGGSFSLFYCAFREMVLWGNDTGYNVKFNKSTSLRNIESAFRKSIGYGKRGDILDSHILPNNVLFSAEGHAFKLETKTDQEILVLLSFLNSGFCQYIINLYCGQHKTNGYINLLPFPLINQDDITRTSKLVVSIINLKRKWISLDETNLEFRHILSLYSKCQSIKNRSRELQQELLNDKATYFELVKKNDDFWINRSNIPNTSRERFEDYRSKRSKENLISIDGLADDSIEDSPFISFEIISNLLGVAFGRWDIRSSLKPELIQRFGDFFDPLPFTPVVSLSEIPSNYPLDIPKDGILVQDAKHPRSVEKGISQAITVIWGSAAEKIQDELAEIGKFQSLEEFINKPSGFFDFHYHRYTKSRREAPIYWPLSTKSGGYSVWVYYPKLNDQTLYKIVNNFIKPKQAELEANIRNLELNANLDNKGKKELAEVHDSLNELQEMEAEILRVAALPYKPNHDDGVLITAAPLHNLFRHAKWRGSTEECWTALEKGEYDWAHLAYAIWPERVTKKCKKDLSMAIAHGLEKVCEIKPKEKKERVKKAPKEIKKDLKLDL